MTYQHYCKCIKCGEMSDLSYLGILSSYEQKSELQKLAKEGCASCKGKNLEWKLTTTDGEQKWTTNQCFKCSQPKIIDILNWEEVKGQHIKEGIKTKEELIKKMNKELKQFCYCDVEDDNQERERERERERDKKIEKLRRKVAKLEAIVNRTPQQEQDLKDKKQELAELEREKHQSQNPKKTNWTPWLIGGGIILILVMGIIAYFLWEKKSSKE